MWVDVEGLRKKVACGPCIRGHRSSKCDHKDRVLQEVRKPGRPLSSCPHPAGTCSCGPISITYTLPKTSSCLCPSDSPAAATPTSTPAPSSNGNRVQKARSRKSTSVISPAMLEKAMNASGQGGVIASPEAAGPPVNASFQDSEPTSSTGGSPASSTSSTPRLGPISPRHPSQSDTSFFPAEYRAVAAKPANVSSCCQPKQTIKEVDSPSEPQKGSCCSSKSQEPKNEVAVKKSCCSGPKSDAQTEQLSMTENRKLSQQNAPSYHQFQFPMNGHFPSGMPSQVPGYGSVGPGALSHMVMPTQVGHSPGNFGMPPGYGFIGPMYGSPAVYQPPTPLATQNGHSTPNGTGQSDMEHNCRCGDGCNCFGCAAHPQNAATTAYLLDMDNFMRNGGSGSLYALPAYPHQPLPVSQQHYGFAYYAPAQGMNMSRPHQTMPFQYNPNQVSESYLQGPDHTWPQSGLRMPVHSTVPTEFEQFNVNGSRDDQSQTPRPSTAKGDNTSNSPAYQDSPGDQDNEPTLSPSTFFLQTLVLPGCNDVTGTCQCGDGCNCVGCLTHGGHDGIPLVPPSNLASPDFDAFIANTNGIAGLADQESFFASPFTEAPS
ncbi:uncharacterized protein BDZ99DRAFT_3147 [Mytilinidion resinicola]|uniref:Copper-fist domain-containing protein n=1 Tax=Mytilinidion resinicola TaxID=574789 RepID=A0A6A6Z744_9PEZI|nr:uncharacterized protein BDZ99DRAFT_3147 [Mytilinidion resinicola]KAF2816850.1 hypothetical protein BDZ99DRAFT_3147 [Mytilinidion resinicola]